MRRTAREARGFPSVLFFFQGTPEQGADFFGRYWPEACAVSDPERFFYDAFGARRGTVGQLVGPRALLSGFRALFKGHLPGKVVGDPLVMPEMVLVRDESVVWRHSPGHAGEQPDFCELDLGASSGVPAQGSS